MRREERGRRGAMRSGWRQGYARDCGQRYEVRYKDGLGLERIFGYAGTAECAQKMVDVILLHPSWTAVQLIDREAKAAG